MKIYFAEFVLVVAIPLFVDNFFARLLLVQMRAFSQHLVCNQIPDSCSWANYSEGEKRVIPCTPWEFPVWCCQLLLAASLSVETLMRHELRFVCLPRGCLCELPAPRVIMRHDKQIGRICSAWSLSLCRTQGLVSRGTLSGLNEWLHPLTTPEIGTLVFISLPV